jgi:hypothetical protein
VPLFVACTPSTASAVPREKIRVMSIVLPYEGDIGLFYEQNTLETKDSVVVFLLPPRVLSRLPAWNDLGESTGVPWYTVRV